jgi:hypothetical protein
MQNTAWVTLLRLVPPVLHNSLVIMTTIGQEFAVQNIFRLEEEYLVIRGRMAGTSDAGRAFMIPYNQINFVGFTKPMKEHDLTAVYNGTYTGALNSEGENAAAPVVETPAPEPVEPPPAEVPTPAPAPPPAPEKKPPSRVLLLERVRARLAAAAKAKSQSGE